MPLLVPLQVVWTFDQFIRPPGPKMVACLCPDLGLFARINTDGWRRGSVPLAARRHPFLAHDSHLECGELVELDDYLIQQAMDHRGVLGRIHPDVVPAILTETARCPTLRASDVEAIRRTLTGA